MARWLFVLCCAVPTCFTLLVILATNTSWYQRRCIAALEDELGLHIGMQVEIEELDHSSPSKWVVGGVRLLDAETSQLVASARNVCWVDDGKQIAIHLSQPSVQSRFVGRITEMLHRQFLCRPDQATHPIRLTADDLTLSSRGASQTWQDLDAWLTPQSDAVAATLYCVPADAHAGCEPLHIQAIRHRGNAEGQTIINIQTGDLQLPTKPLADYWPVLDSLGNEATFHGSCSVVRHDEPFGTAWSIDLSGAELTQIDLARLTEELPHRVTGKASLSLQRCQIDQQGTVNISGQIVSQGGWMAASILPKLAEDLNCQLTIPIEQDFQYDVLALRVDVYASQLQIAGVAGMLPEHASLSPDVVVSAGGQPLVVSQEGWLPAINLARMVAPAHSVHVPLASQTTGLLSILRAPSSSPLTDTTPSVRVSQLNRTIDASQPVVQPR